MGVDHERVSGDVSSRGGVVVAVPVVMEAGFTVEVLAGEAEIDGRAARRRFLPERAGIPTPHRAAPRVGGVAGRQQMVRVQIEDGFRTSSVDLRQRLPVRIDVFADQIAGAVILPDQRPAGTVDIMGGIAPGHLLGALVKAPKSKKQMEDIQEYLVSRDIFKRIYRFF